MNRKYKTITQYISSFPDEISLRLEKIRNAIQQAAPRANEKISYNMPAFELKGNLVYFGAFSNHISLFPHAKVIEEFKNDLVKFKTSKGTIQFPHSEKLPVTLIKKIVRFRVAENEAKALAKVKSKRKSNVKAR